MGIPFLQFRRSEMQLFLFCSIIKWQIETTTTSKACRIPLSPDCRQVNNCSISKAISQSFAFVYLCLYKMNSSKIAHVQCTKESPKMISFLLIVGIFITIAVSRSFPINFPFSNNFFDSRLFQLQPELLLIKMLLSMKSFLLQMQHQDFFAITLTN